MEYRNLGNAGVKVSEVGLNTSVESTDGQKGGD